MQKLKKGTEKNFGFWFLKTSMIFICINVQKQMIWHFKALVEQYCLLKGQPYILHYNEGIIKKPKTVVIAIPATFVGLYQ